MKRGAAGAIAAQGVQALASFVLQVWVARALGLSGLGVFAILYGTVVLAAGLISGFVGDSLVVLERRTARIRGALQVAAVALAVATGLVAAIVCAAVGLISVVEALVLAAAILAFCLEEVLRRTLMADLLFWRVVAMDAVGLAVAIAVLTVASLASPPGLAVFLAALAAGQVAALLVGIRLLPVRERFLAPFAVAGLREVASYGVWRGLQQLLRPALLTGVRSGIGLFAGLAATGLVEAARVYVAPALLVVSGSSSFLFAAFAGQTARPMSERLRRSDRAVVALVLTTIAVGAVALVALPVLGPLLFGTAPDPVAVLGWLLYTASVAAVTPYGALAAAGGRQSSVFGIRLGDTVLSLAAVVIALALGMPPAWSAAVLAAGSLTGGLVLRLGLLHRPSIRRSTTAADRAA